MKRASVLFVICFLLSLVAFASGGGHHSDGEIVIPVKTVMWQCLNLLVLFIGLGYVLKASITKYFSTRQESYLHQASKFKAARDDAEKQYLDVLHKIQELGKNRESDLDRAREEAAALRLQMVKEAHEVADRIKLETKAALSLEFQRAQQQVKETMLNESLKLARAAMSKELGNSDHQKLNTEFVSNLEAVP